MEKGTKSRQRVIWLAGITLFTVFIWVALDSYHELVRRDRLEDVSQLLTPLNPELDEEIIEKIEQRREYELEEVDQYLKAEPTPEPTADEEEGEEEETPDDEVVLEDEEAVEIEEPDLENLETEEPENIDE